MSDEIRPVGEAIAEYSATDAALSELRGRLAGVVYDVATTEGNKAARAARLELVTLRTDLEKKRKALKEPALEYSRRIDSEAKRITTEIVAIEQPIDAQIKADEARRERERQERAEAERRRVASIMGRIDRIRDAGLAVWNAGASEIREAVARMEAMPIGESFAEFAQAAQEAKDLALQRMRESLAKAEAAEEAARLAEAERERLAAERAAAAEAARVERERLQAELAAERKRLAAEHAEQQRLAAEARARQDAELAEKHRQAREAQAQLDAERQAFEARQAEALQAEAKRAAAAADERARAALVERQTEDRESQADAERERADHATRLHAGAEQLLVAAREVLRTVIVLHEPAASAMNALAAAVAAIDGTELP